MNNQRSRRDNSSIGRSPRGFGNSFDTRGALDSIREIRLPKGESELASSAFRESLSRTKEIALTLNKDGDREGTIKVVREVFLKMGELNRLSKEIAFSVIEVELALIPPRVTYLRREAGFSNVFLIFIEKVVEEIKNPFAFNLGLALVEALYGYLYRPENLREERGSREGATNFEPKQNRRSEGKDSRQEEGESKGGSEQQQPSESNQLSEGRSTEENERYDDRREVAGTSPIEERVNNGRGEKEAPRQELSQKERKRRQDDGELGKSASFSNRPFDLSKLMSKS
jgi:hypothetical protein